VHPDRGIRRNAAELTPPRAAANFPALPPSLPMKTFSAKAEQVDRKWWIIDARDQVLGRVAVKAANLLRGKEKAIVTPHVDTGDFVVVINADKVRLTGKKEEQKTFMSFSGFVGGHKSENARARRARHPELLVEHAVRGMIPHNRLGRAVYRKLKVYSGEEHPHAAQQPQAITLD
jgi:large subunit ribosomal protein L13